MSTGPIDMAGRRRPPREANVHRTPEQFSVSINRALVREGERRGRVTITSGHASEARARANYEQWGGRRMFKQLLTPMGDSLGLSFLVAVLPILAVLVLLGVLRRPAWQAALAGLLVGLIIAVTAW